MFHSTLPRALAAAMLFTLAVPAQAQDYTLDNPHTQIVFAVDHIGFSKSIGKFTDYTGTIALDQNDVTKSVVDVTIKTASIDLEDQKWNDHMKNADFFNVEKFPTMTFKSTSIVKTGDKTADVIGDLTLLGVTKPVMLKVTHNKTGTRPNGGEAIGFSGTAVLKRSDFGMNYGIGMIGDDVEIRLEVEGNKIAGSTP